MIMMVRAGAASGIGRAVALTLASQGCRLALTDRDSEGGRSVCEEIKKRSEVDVVFATLDVTSQSSSLCSPKRHRLDRSERMYALTRAWLAECRRRECGQAGQDVLQDFPTDRWAGQLRRSVRLAPPKSLTHPREPLLATVADHSRLAGINLPLPLTHDTPLDSFTSTLSINLTGTFSFCRAYLSQLVRLSTEGGGIGSEAPVGGFSIVNIGSNASLQGLPNMSAYCASKHAIVGLSKTMAREYAPRGVRVNMVAPGAIDTPLLDAILEKGNGKSHEELLDGIPLGRIGHAREVANVVAFLLSAEASYVTVSRLWEVVVVARGES